MAEINNVAGVGSDGRYRGIYGHSLPGYAPSTTMRMLAMIGKPYTGDPSQFTYEHLAPLLELQKKGMLPTNEQIRSWRPGQMFGQEPGSEDLKKK